MVNERLRYIQSFVDAVDSVESGRKGMISDNDLLISGYRAEYYDIIKPQLKNRNPLVVKETVQTTQPTEQILAGQRRG